MTLQATGEGKNQDESKQSDHAVSWADSATACPLRVARSGDAQPVAIRALIDLHDDALDGHARRLAAADALHPDEAGGFGLRERPREVRLCPPGHGDQLRDGLRSAVADQCQ